MPSRRDGRIEPGQPLKSAISAAAWNRAQDAADVVLGQRPGVSAEGRQAEQATYISAVGQNGYGRDLLMYEPVHYNAQTSPTIGFRPPLRLGPPSDSLSTMYPFAVTLEPIRNGRYGRVAVSGIVQCRVSNSASGANQYVILEPENAPGATANPSGWAKVLQTAKQEENLLLIDLNQQCHTLVSLYTPSLSVDGSGTFTERNSSRQFRGINFHVNLPVGPKQLVFSGPSQAGPGGSTAYILVAALCESEEAP